MCGVKGQSPSESRADECMYLCINLYLFYYMSIDCYKFKEVSPVFSSQKMIKPSPVRLAGKGQHQGVRGQGCQCEGSRVKGRAYMDLSRSESRTFKSPTKMLGISQSETSMLPEGAGLISIGSKPGQTLVPLFQAGMACQFKG